MKNFIKYIKIDGCPERSPEVKNGFIICQPPIVFGTKIIIIETSQILLPDDIVKTDDGAIRVNDRIYYPEDNHFDFLLEDVYTGRRV